MFVLKASKTFSTIVKFSLPGEDGQKEQVSFKAIFEHKKQAELEKFPEAAAAAKNDSTLARDLLVGIADIQHEDGEPVTIDELLDLPGAATAVIFAFLDAYKEAPRKN